MLCNWFYKAEIRQEHSCCCCVHKGLICPTWDVLSRHSTGIAYSLATNTCLNNRSMQGDCVKSGRVAFPQGLRARFAWLFLTGFIYCSPAWMMYSLVVRARGLEYGGHELESRSLHLKPETKLREESGLSGCRKGLKTVPLAQALLSKNNIAPRRLFSRSFSSPTQWKGFADNRWVDTTAISWGTADISAST